MFLLRITYAVVVVVGPSVPRFHRGQRGLR